MAGWTRWEGSGPQPSQAMQHAAETYRCPAGCQPDVRLRHMNGEPKGFWHLDVFHDDDCPMIQEETP